jgi:hypothetical protein
LTAPIDSPRGIMVEMNGNSGDNGPVQCLRLRAKFTTRGSGEITP